jgi:hypothetical protein
LASPRRPMVLVLLAVVACLGVAGVVRGGIFRTSHTAPIEPVEGRDVATESGSIGLALADVLRIPDASSSDSRPDWAAVAFYWGVERTLRKSIGELWKEEDSRLSLVADPAPEAPATRPRVASEDVEKARSIVVRGMVVGPNGSWAILSTGRVRKNDRIPASPFRVESIDAKSVTLVAEDERVILEVASSRPGKVRTVQR